MENAVAIESFAIDFLNALVRRISSSSGEERERLFSSNAHMLLCSVSTPFSCIRSFARCELVRHLKHLASTTDCNFVCGQT